MAANIIQIQPGCAGCAYCKLICTTSAIKIEGGRAEIGPDCTGCRRCISYCPLRLIQPETGREPEYSA